MVNTTMNPASTAATEPQAGWANRDNIAGGWLGLAMMLVDELECGLIVCDAKSRIHFANQAAHLELERPYFVGVTQGLVRPTAGTTGDLLGAVRQAAERDRRALVRLIRGNDEMLASVVPLHRSANEARVLVVLGRSQPCSDLGLEMLATSYGLTHAERRVLAALMREARPREIAAQHRVGLPTVRTQISAIRQKMGTRSIEGVLLRAAAVPPVAGAMRTRVFVDFGAPHRP